MRTPSVPALGHCIYCWPDPDGGSYLTKEHIIPACLGGRIVWPDSSCNDCQKITGHNEQLFSRNMYWALRMKLDINSGRTEKRTHWPATIEDTETGEHTDIQLSVDQMPRVYAVPELPVPGILLNLPPSNSNPAMNVRLMSRKEELDALGEYTGAGQFQVGAPFDWFAFCRLLAKIGHACSAYSFLETGYTPLLRDIIRERSLHLSYYIGGLSPDDGQLSKRFTYKATITRHDDIDYLVAFINIFKDASFPTYQAIVGQITDLDFIRSKIAQAHIS